MSSEINLTQQKNFITSEIKDDLQEVGFTLSATPDTGVMWGFDGSTKYFPRDTYIREKRDGKPEIKLRVEKTTNGFILIVNSNPFKPQNHLDRSQLRIDEVIPIIKEYISLL